MLTIESIYYVKKDGSMIQGNIKYSLYDFLIKHNFDLESITIFIDDCYGKGAGARYKDIAYIEINANEPEHLNMPHVHIYTINKTCYCRMYLGDSITQVKSDDLRFSEVFRNRKTRKTIMSFLEENKEDLINFYNRITSGEMVKGTRFLITKDGKFVSI